MSWLLSLLMVVNFVSPVLSPSLAEAAENTILQPQTLEISDLQNIALSDAQEYNLSTKQTSRFMATLTCEGGWNATSTGDHNTSFGLAQIHLPAHPDVSKDEALDPIFSLNWAAQNFSKNPLIWSCYRRLYAS